MDLTIISLPEEVKDPDELIQKDPTLWQKAINDAEGVVDWLLTQYTKREDMSAPIGKRRFTTAALAVVRALKDPVEQEHYLNTIAAYTSTSLEAVKEKLYGEVPETSAKQLKPVAAHEEVTPDPAVHQDTLLAVAAIDVPARELLADVSEAMLATDPRKAFLAYLKKNNDLLDDVPEVLQEHETYVKIVLLKADARYGQWSSEDRYFEAARLIRLIITEHRKTQKDALTTALRQAEDIGDEAEAVRLRQALNELIKEIPRAKR